MALAPSSPIIRARQRSRTKLPAFSPALMPRFEQVGVDRLQIKAVGNWHAVRDRPDSMTAEEYLDNAQTAHTEVSWFRQPQRTTNKVSIALRARANCTIGEMAVKVTKSSVIGGQIHVDITGNPTRTLAHLIASYGERQDFISHIQQIPYSEFFERTANDFQKALGAKDNWLPDSNLVFERLGTDAYSVFLPIYVEQIREVIASVLAPSFTTRRTFDGTDDVMTEGGLAVRLNWGSVRVPQIECFMERHHSSAIAAVRTGAINMLNCVDSARARTYLNERSHWVERIDDSVSITTATNDTHNLSIYAKAPRRIRFELKRHGRGDYSSLPFPTSPGDRLMGIMNLERANFIAGAQWEVIGPMFEDGPRPTLPDLVGLCAAVSEVCVAHGQNVRLVLERLLSDAGLSVAGHDGLPASFVRALQTAGLVQRVSIRRRDHRRPTKRYCLTPHYAAVADAAALAMQ